MSNISLNHLTEAEVQTAVYRHVARISLAIIAWPNESEAVRAVLPAGIRDEVVSTPYFVRRIVSHRQSSVPSPSLAKCAMGQMSTSHALP